LATKNIYKKVKEFSAAITFLAKMLEPKREIWRLFKKNKVFFPNLATRKKKPDNLKGI